MLHSNCKEILTFVSNIIVKMQTVLGIDKRKQFIIFFENTLIMSKIVLNTIICIFLRKLWIAKSNWYVSTKIYNFTCSSVEQVI